MTDIKRDSGARHRAELRVNAEQLIQGGAAPAVGDGVLGVDALELLYRRASNPEFAPDALKLLHELQTHQVELDLMFDQMKATEAELAEELTHYRGLYDQAPMPYLVVDTGGRIVESNRAALDLFGHPVERLAEHHLSDLLAPASRAALRSMMQALSRSPAETGCVVALASDIGHHDYLTVKARPAPSGDLVLVVLSPNPVAPAA